MANDAITKARTILRDDFSATSIDTKISTRPTRKTDLRTTYTGTLDQTSATVGSVRGYGTRKGT